MAYDVDDLRADPTRAGIRGIVEWLREKAATKQYVDGLTQLSAFHAHKNGTNQASAGTGYTKLTWASTDYNDGSDFSTANDRYDAPVAGRYAFGAQAWFTGPAPGDGLWIAVYVDGVLYRQSRVLAGFSAATPVRIHVEASLAAAATVEIYARNDTAAARGNVSGVDDLTYFYGHLIRKT